MDLYDDLVEMLENNDIAYNGTVVTKLARVIEDLNGDLVYSQHRHDFRMMKNGNMIDGGRAYVRANGMIRSFEVKDGEFVEIE